MATSLPFLSPVKGACFCSAICQIAELSPTGRPTEKVKAMNNVGQCEACEANRLFCLSRSVFQAHARHG